MSAALVNKAVSNILDQLGQKGNVEVTTKISSEISKLIGIVQQKKLYKDEDMFSLIFGSEIKASEPIERKFLGSLINGTGSDRLMARNGVPVDVLHTEELSLIYEAILKLDENGSPVDVDMINQQLKESPYALSKAFNTQLDRVGAMEAVLCSSAEKSGLNLQIYIDKLVRLWTMRKIVQESIDLISKVGSSSTDDAISLRQSAISGFTAIGSDIRANDKSMLPETLAVEMKEWGEGRKKAAESGITFHGLHTPIPGLTEITRGWKPGELATIGAYPGDGKTSFLICDAYQAWFEHKEAVKIYTLEMTKLQICLRFAAIYLDIPYSNLEEWKLTPEEEARYFEEFIPAWKASEILIDDTSKLTSLEIHDRTRLSLEQFDLKRVYTDYLQIMGWCDPKRDKTHNIGLNSQNLALAAKDTGVFHMSLSQFRRPEKGKKRRGRMEDLRGSGEIEQSSHLILSVFASENADIELYEDQMPTKNTREIFIDKFRNGARMGIRVGFEGPKMKFGDLDPWHDKELEDNVLTPLSTDIGAPPIQLNFPTEEEDYFA